MTGFALVIALLFGPQAEAPDAVAASVPQPLPTPLDPVAVTADEPRFVAPTRRDRIGRIWAPVVINGQGPFRLVLDTGASHSAITAQVARALGIPLDGGQTVLLRGATGSARVPLVPVESLEIGDLLMHPRRLPIVPDALGGAEGILGTDGLANKRIHIDFRRDRITIRRSRSEPAGEGFITIPVEFMRGRLLVVEARMGGVPTKAIIDTGGQATLGNVALREALAERRRRMELEPDQVIGATLDVQDGDRTATPSLIMGGMRVTSGAMTFADFAIFDHWKMLDEPAMLVGMDVLGLLEVLVIDYRRRELQVKLRDRSVRSSLLGT
ncbi:MAG TPA: retropepsin-like aspartic protease [Steroidobacteraceae bacterium]|nr:retropepsin-like aspartic protease [Steroidobacteraceae bacterium]